MKTLKFTLLLAALVACSNPVAPQQKHMQPPLRLAPPQLQPDYTP
ncbi:MAG TPA: hypothetical protein VM166_15490 [Gemmatimonadaceae bacterium]|nr:hypothetical protein [Gemmatimonadaceae bacterium]